MTRIVLVAMAIFTYWGCDTNTGPQPIADPTKLKEDLIGANKILTHSESDDIDRYIERHGWKMDSTGSGLRILVYKNGEGPAVTTGKRVTYAYTRGLLNGTTCYTSDKNGPGSFTVGKGGVESGLEEAMLLLRVGDKAKLILPSHLAFGLPGDGDCIPKRAVLVMDVEIKSIN